MEKKVEDYLRDSQALQDYWHRPITPDQLQAEMERIASHTKQPGVLRELFTALGNDPSIIAECLARPALADRLLRNWYAHDQRIHRNLKERAEADLLVHPTVEQMKQLSGMYSEIELVRSDSPREEATRSVGHGEQLNSHEWDETVQKLRAIFGDYPVTAVPAAPEHPKYGLASRPVATTEIRIGVMSPLQEDETRYYAEAVIEKAQDRLKLARVTWIKEPVESWVAKAERQMPVTMAAVSANYTLPVISSYSDNSIPSGACTYNMWTPAGFTNVPDAREFPTAVWTGSEMIVWGGYPQLNTGGRYNPSTDSWTATSTVNAPAGRELHTAVWTGTEMIVWGGDNGSGLYFNTGGRYNPSTDSWIATSIVNAPNRRDGHTAVWTGNEMIVWGGYNDDFLNSGGRYNPSTDTWTATSATSAPDARRYHTAVWTGTEMIVWGRIC